MAAQSLIPKRIASSWGQEIAAELNYLAGKISEQNYIKIIDGLEYTVARDEKYAKKNLYQTIGFKNRIAGNFVAAKNAYSKAASREWGDEVSYETVDRRLEEMSQAVLAMDTDS